MQPLAYFATRALLGWLQFTERSKRAFMSNPLVLVAAGAAHCWAVVYALFVAIHTRAMRYDEYHDGYTEHLPSSVAWTETLATASLSVWWLAGFTTAAVRILDDDAADLPMELGDTKGNTLTKTIRHPMFHTVLAAAHTVSCVGLFVSILLLCITIATMSGTITVCELCLVVIAAAFALPHAVVAAQRLGPSASAALPLEAAAAAASEAAAIGPQLCVLLSLADTPGHAYMWQNFTYLVASAAFLGAVVASTRSPPKGSCDALPPEPLETFTCLALDVAASVCILLCFPHLNTYDVWLLAVILVVLAASLHIPGWREFYVDLLEPLFVIRSDTAKRLPGQTRQLMRKSCWFIALVAAATATWDICLHPVQEELRYGAAPPAWNVAPDHDALFNFRWKSTLAEAPTNANILTSAASALQVESHFLRVEQTWPEHRLTIFKYTGPVRDASETALVTRWAVQAHAREGALEEILDHGFAADTSPLVCNMIILAGMRKGDEQDAEQSKVDELDGGSEQDSIAALKAACAWSEQELAKTNQNSQAEQSST